MPAAQVRNLPRSTRTPALPHPSARFFGLKLALMRCGGEGLKRVRVRWTLFRSGSDGPLNPTSCDRRKSRCGNKIASAMVLYQMRAAAADAPSDGRRQLAPLNNPDDFQ